MKRKNPFSVFRLTVALPLIFCAFVCIFYRGSNNYAHLLFDFLSLGNLAFVKTFLQSSLPLNEHLIYSVPEGLWIFSMTLLGSHFFLCFRNRKIHLTHFALLFALALEGMQFFHFTDGTFDWMDIAASIGFWLMGSLLVHESWHWYRSRPINTASVYFFLLAFVSVYFADTLSS